MNKVKYVFIGLLLVLLKTLNAQDIDKQINNTFKKVGVINMVDTALAGEIRGLTRRTAKMEGELTELTNLLRLSLSRNEEAERKNKDTIEILRLQITITQMRLRNLRRKEDSLQSIRVKDSLFLESLVQDYNRQLDENLGPFWQNNAEFNPYSNVQCINYMEKGRLMRYANLTSAYYPHNQKYRNCNSCIRKNPEDWSGIIVNGQNYYFDNQSIITTLGGPSGKPFTTLKLKIPEYGAIAIGVLRKYYTTYTELHEKRKETITRQYEVYLQDKSLNLREILNPSIKCKKVVGDLIVRNQTGSKVLFKLYNHAANLEIGSRDRYEPVQRITITIGEDGNLFQLSEGYYKYEVYISNGLSHFHSSGQLRIVRCENRTLTVR